MGIIIAAISMAAVSEASSLWVKFGGVAGALVGAVMIGKAVIAVMKSWL